MTLILGAGLAGLSASYHLGHEHCLLVEKNAHPGGHIRSTRREGFTWDEGPHISFTRNEYVRSLFARSVQNEFVALAVRARNYFRGHWIDHPAQCHLHQVPEPLRSRCVQSFLERRAAQPDTVQPPPHYGEWLDNAYGPVFAEMFPAAYTRKYWTVDAAELGTDWIGPRMFYPAVDDVLQGAKGSLGKETHYITQARYPTRGGYQSFTREIAEGARVRLGAAVERIDLRTRQVTLAGGEVLLYDRLINTLPLPWFIGHCAQATPEVRHAAKQLRCSRLLLVNVAAPHPTRQAGHWFYVYDEDKLSTRINCTERLSPENAPRDCTGVQVEVYFPNREEPTDAAAVADKVVHELVEMGFIDESSRTQAGAHTVSVPWANVIFDHQRRAALDCILEWLVPFGLAREAEDLQPGENWTEPGAVDRGATLLLAGRFAQWKYFWTDDCVLRGAKLAGRL